MKAYLVDVFTAEPGKGNPGAVVLGAGDLTPAEMGGIAARLGVETTFVDGTRLRYFQPGGAAMTLCGHGTLAALAVLRDQGRSGRFTVTPPAGELAVEIQPYILGMQVPAVTLGEPVDPYMVARVLGLDADRDLVTPIQSGSAGRPKLLIPVTSGEVLDSLGPDPSAVAELCAATGTTGLYPFTLKARGFGTIADARHFPAGSGIAEDPVTGVAAAALAWYLWTHSVAPGCGSLKIEQGHKMGRPGMIAVKQEAGGHTWIYGQALLSDTVEV